MMMKAIPYKVSVRAVSEGAASAIITVGFDNEDKWRNAFFKSLISKKRKTYFRHCLTWFNSRDNMIRNIKKWGTAYLNNIFMSSKKNTEENY
jgi:hypothetical protein